MKTLQAKRLMILGAGTGQLPMIRKAVDLGCYVITVDNIPENVGHRLAQHSINCSTVDHPALLKFARELAIDGVVTFASDVATTGVAFIAEQLGLPGCGLTTAATMSNKANFRLFQQTQGLPHPTFFICQRFAQLDSVLAQLPLPLIFKPIDTSGSRGISSVHNHHQQSAIAAFDRAQRFSRSGVISVEQLLSGIDVSGDGFLVDGHLFALITHKYKHGFTPTGHRFPSPLSAAEQQRILDAVTTSCHALGYLNGPIDFDVMLTEEQVFVVEMSPRLGGNGIPKLIEHASGVDLITQTIAYALNHPLAMPTQPERLTGCGSHILGSSAAGTLQGVASAAAIRAQVPEVFDYAFNYPLGSKIAAFEHSGNGLGFALFDCQSVAHYQDIIVRLNQAMQLHVQADGIS